jgi:hypothetical protein
VLFLKCLQFIIQMSEFYAFKIYHRKSHTRIIKDIQLKRTHFKDSFKNSTGNIYINYGFYTWCKSVDVLYYYFLILGFFICKTNVGFNPKSIFLTFEKIEFCITLQQG